MNGKKQMLRLVIGDESGVVNAFFPATSEIVVGGMIALVDCEARVVKEHIEIQVGRNGSIEEAKKSIKRVNNDYNVSEKSWVPVE